MKRILVTGSTGFLGKHFINFLNHNFPEQYQIIESNTKINNLLEWDNIFTNKISDVIGYGNNFDYIFHFACHTKAGNWCETHQGEQWLINQQINTNILKYWKERHPLATLITLGTSCSYGADCDRIESNYLKYEPEPSLQTYAYTKRMLYLGLDALNKQYGMRYYYLVPPTLFGTDFGENDQHFIYDIIRKIYKVKQEGGLIEMWGDGTQRRELLWIEDFIKIMLAISTTNNGYSNQITNIGMGIDFTMDHYYNAVCKFLDVNPIRIVKNEDKYVGMKSNRLTITQQAISYYPFERITDCIQKVIKFYENTANNNQ